MKTDKKFRVWNGVEWCGKVKPGYALDINDYDYPHEVILQEFTGLYDRNGKEIFEGDRLRFHICEATEACKKSQAIWDGTVIYEDGVPTIDILTPSQVKNPENWTQPHDWINSRSWACQVGYGEFGDWNVPRKPLTEIHNGFGGRTEDYEKFYKPIGQKYGFEKRYLNVDVIGNICENDYRETL